MDGFAHIAPSLISHFLDRGVRILTTLTAFPDMGDNSSHDEVTFHFNSTLKNVFTIENHFF